MLIYPYSEYACPHNKPDLPPEDRPQQQIMGNAVVCTGCGKPMGQAYQVEPVVEPVGEW